MKIHTRLTVKGVHIRITYEDDKILKVTTRPFVGLHPWKALKAAELLTLMRDDPSFVSNLLSRIQTIR